jgi:hypothetical protein
MAAAGDRGAYVGVGELRGFEGRGVEELFEKSGAA